MTLLALHSVHVAVNWGNQAFPETPRQLRKLQTFPKFPATHK